MDMLSEAYLTNFSQSLNCTLREWWLSQVDWFTSACKGIATNDLHLSENFIVFKSVNVEANIPLLSNCIVVQS
jgi:hypothetical protein